MEKGKNEGNEAKNERETWIRVQAGEVVKERARGRANDIVWRAKDTRVGRRGRSTEQIKKGEKEGI